MSFIAYSFLISNAYQGQYCRGQHTGVWLAVHWKEMLKCFELTNGRLLGITTDNASLNYSITHKLHTTLKLSGIEWPASGDHISSMEHVILLALGVLMSSLGVKGRTMSWTAHECDQQFGANERIDIGKSQRLRKEDNARINKVSTMRPSLGKII